MRLPLLLCLMGLLGAGCSGATTTNSSPEKTTPAAANSSPARDGTPTTDQLEKQHREAEDKAKEEIATRWHGQVKTDDKLPDKPVVAVNLSSTRGCPTSKSARAWSTSPWLIPRFPTPVWRS